MFPFQTAEAWKQKGTRAFSKSEINHSKVQSQSLKQYSEKYARPVVWTMVEKMPCTEKNPLSCSFIRSSLMIPTNPSELTKLFKENSSPPSSTQLVSPPSTSAHD